MPTPLQQKERMELIAIVQQAWRWTGLDPDQIVGENDFGNLLIKDRNGSYWRLCPEDLYCEAVARTREQLDQLSRDAEFVEDWQMQGLVEAAQERLGALQPGFKYCLKVPGVLGGEYGGDNLATISLTELIAASGQLAQEVSGLADGTKLKIDLVD